jgi:hypothetical protein
MIIIMHANASPTLVPKLSSCLLLDRYLLSKSGMEDYFGKQTLSALHREIKEGYPHL